MFERRPRTAEEREAEIAELAARRDKLLDRAHATLNRQGFATLGCAAIVGWAIVQILMRPLYTNALIALTFFGLMLLLCLYSALRTYRNPPRAGDDWSAADRVNYDTESPRDLQAKIDRLREKGRSDRD